ncbi:hypothetical protein C0J52_21679 [Blattella germanica]|nr:hypothetical protein C0J52_21679 [Blattella germanica]
MAEQPTPLEEEPPPSEEVKKSEDTLIIVETERPNRCHMCLVCAKLYWRTFVVILVPLIFLPLLFINKDLEKVYLITYCTRLKTI